MAQRYDIPIEPNPACFSRVGELVVRWGWIENQAGVLIRELLRLKKPEGFMAIVNLSIQAKCKVLISLGQHAVDKRDPTRSKRIVYAAKAMQAFDDFRNDIVHGLWVHAPEGSSNLALLQRKSLEQKVDPIADSGIMARLDAKLVQLRALQTDAQAITKDLKKLLRVK